MKKYQFILFLPLFIIGGCSSSEDTATQETSDKAFDKTAPIKISKDNPFSGQVEALNAAKAVGAAAQQSIDKNQQKLEDAKH